VLDVCAFPHFTDPNSRPLLPPYVLRRARFRAHINSDFFEALLKFGGIANSITVEFKYLSLRFQTVLAWNAWGPVVTLHSNTAWVPVLTIVVQGPADTVGSISNLTSRLIPFSPQVWTIGFQLFNIRLFEAEFFRHFRMVRCSAGPFPNSAKPRWQRRNRRLL